MAKKKSAPPKTEPPYERPLVFPLYTFEALTLEERVKFREFIVSPLFRKVIRNAFTKRPGVVPKGTGTAVLEHSQLIANNRLHQIQGWEMFEAAFFSQAETIIERPKSTVQEKYNEEST
jgi:hypothetical protein